MQITVEDISPVEKRVEFEVPWTEVAPRLETAYEKLRREVRLHGFRPGKVPRSVVEKLYRGQVEDEVARDLVELSIGQAIHDRQLEPVAPPSVDKLELKAGEPLRFTARVEVRSQVTPKDYSGIALERRPVKITDEQIAQALESYQRQHTEFKPVEGRELTAESDLVLAEVHGRVGEHKIKTRTLTIDLSDPNAGGLPDLGIKLRGVPVNVQGLEIKYKIADDTPAKALAGKDVSLRVTVKEVRERKVPALDDELAKDTGEASTLDELKQKVREKLAEVEQQRIKRELSAALMKEVVKRNDFVVAPSLIDRFSQSILMRARAQLAMAGVDMGAGGFDEAAMRKEFASEAEHEAKSSILLQAIAERESITVDEGDVQKRVVELAKSRGESPKKMRSELESSGRIEGLKAQLLEEKALELLLSQAKISDADPAKFEGPTPGK
jgi:trigger factor